MFEITGDYFAAEQVLSDHLMKIEGIKRVYTSREIADVTEKSQNTPSLHVVYYGDQLPDTSNGGSLMQIKQVWLVILAVKEVQSGSGELLTKVIQSLAGKMIGDMGTWVRTNSPVRPSFAKGFSYYPLAFTCQMKMKTQRK